MLSFVRKENSDHKHAAAQIAQHEYHVREIHNQQNADGVEHGFIAVGRVKVRLD